MREIVSWDTDGYRLLVSLSDTSGWTLYVEKPGQPPLMLGSATPCQLYENLLIMSELRVPQWVLDTLWPEVEKELRQTGSVWPTRENL